MPFCCSQGSLGGQSVVLAYSASNAVWAALAGSPVVHISKPTMRVTVRTLIADPLHLHIAVRPDNTASKGGICRVVPLSLQDWVQQADIWPQALYCLFTA